MKFVPNSITRAGGRSILKVKLASPTVLVVGGVIGLGTSAVLAAVATRKLDPILDEHKKARAEIGYVKSQGQDKVGQKALLSLYTQTGWELTKIYGPAVVIGSTSAIAILGGHKILRRRQLAALAAYSGLAEQFASYRQRIVKTLGEDMERSIYEGAHGEYTEDPNHKGEYKLTPKFDPAGAQDAYLRPWFDENNVNWTRDPMRNYLFLKGVQQHMNNILQIRGHVMLSDVYDALKIQRRGECFSLGWVYNSERGDNYVDFGFMTGDDPQSVAFRNGEARNVRLNFNVDGPVQELI